MKIAKLNQELNEKDKTIDYLKYYKKEFENAVKRQERAEESEQKTLKLNAMLQEKVINNTATIMSKFKFVNKIDLF